MEDRRFPSLGVRLPPGDSSNTTASGRCPSLGFPSLTIGHLIITDRGFISLISLSSKVQGFLGKTWDIFN